MSALIVDGAVATRGTLAAWAAGPLADLAARRGVRVPPLTTIAQDAPPAQAMINHGRWIALCPDCPGAELVWRDGPYLMLCASCWNWALGTRWRPVLMPPPGSVEQIEAILLRRPNPATRNWDGESVDVLLAENVAHLGEP